MMSMEIIGECPYCKREVNKDLQPVNKLEEKEVQKISCILENTKQGDQSLLSMAVQGNTQFKADASKCKCFIGLDLAEDQIDRKKNKDDIVALLEEEDLFIKDFMGNHLAARTMRGGRRRR
ncbi:GL18798 [Drosophila persimilis]|uniref:GL18798 n=1 Tax=Drosophila persimilis TaxID=7234 RepID=B4G8N8_DROPE|nr:GL18798 [Drosophila persimilis]